MRNRTAVLGLLAMAVMIAVAIVFLSGKSGEQAAAVVPGVVGSDSPAGETLDVPCSSCDLRHRRLRKDQSGID